MTPAGLCDRRIGLFIPDNGAAATFTLTWAIQDDASLTVNKSASRFIQLLELAGEKYVFL